MTLHEVSSQLYNLSLDGFFNHEKFTKRQLHDILDTFLNRQYADGIQQPVTHIMEIALPDGWWMFRVTRYGNGKDQYDYWIPDSKEQSVALWDSLFQNQHKTAS